jgi:hypothetical protein
MTYPFPHSIALCDVCDVPKEVCETISSQQLLPTHRDLHTKEKCYGLKLHFPASIHIIGRQIIIIIIIIIIKRRKISIKMGVTRKDRIYE